NPGGGNVTVGNVTPTSSFEVYELLRSGEGAFQYGMRGIDPTVYNSSPKSGIALSGFIDNTHLGTFAGIMGAKENATLADGKGYLSLYTHGGGGIGSVNEAVHIDSSGNVGIGTATPTTALDLKGALTQEGMAAPGLSPAGQGRI